MRTVCLACLLAGTLAWGQAKPAVPTPSLENRPPAADKDDKGQEAQKPDAAASVAPGDPVITIKGLCDERTEASGSASSSAGCQTVITRAEFEKIAGALMPTMAPQMRQQLANAYPRLLVMAHDAEKRGLAQGEQFDERMHFARLQILSQELSRALQEESAQISDKEIEDYYHNNTAAYEQATLERIFVPRSKQLDPPKEKLSDDEMKARQKAGEDEMTKVADSLHTRAVAGGDFTTLQKDAFEAAGIKSTPPSPSLGKMRRTSLPPTHSAAFDLKPGEVSQVLNDAGGHYFYKLEAKEVQPLDAVKEEIKRMLQNQRMQDAMQKIQQSFTADLNQAYFGAAMPAGPMGAQPRPMQTVPKPARPAQKSN